jgi:4a-hydroxytetrahydrobiopterin dehydratase
MSEASHWEETEEGLRAEFSFKDFKEAMSFVNQVAELAEARNHHPDIEISYNRVRMRLVTHSEGRVTAKDRELAAEISRSYERASRGD